MKVSAGVPTRSVSATAALARPSRFMNRPSSGVAITSGRPVVSQWASALAATASSSGAWPIRSRSSEPSSWSAGEQPVERRAGSRAARRATGSPGRCGPSSVRSGPIANGVSTVDDEEEQHADAGAAADPDGELHVAANRARARSSRGPPAAVHGAAFEPDRAVGRGDDQAAAGEVLPHQVGETSPGPPRRAPRSARRAARSAAARRRAGRSRAAAAGRRKDRRPAGRPPRRARLRQRRATASSPPPR